MKRIKRTVYSFNVLILFHVLAITLFTSATVACACTSGVANGEKTVDGRPLLWKCRMEKVMPNDVRFYPAGIDHDGDGTQDPYSYLGMGEVAKSLRMGLNSQGVATGANSLNGATIPELPHPIVLGNFTTISEIKASYAKDDMDEWRHILFATDAQGSACLWEGQVVSIPSPTYFEYDVTAAARDGQSYNGVDLSGWIVRANLPGHYKTDGSDDLSITESRYSAAMDVVTQLITDGNLSAKSIMQNFLRYPPIFDNPKYPSVSSMVTHGVLPGEDPRLTTMWASVGYARTSIFIPLWVHGVDKGAGGVVPYHLTYNAANPADSFTYLANTMKSTRNRDKVEARIIPFEEHFFDVVTKELLPNWRTRSDWDSIAKEMNRVSVKMNQDAFDLMACINQHGATTSASIPPKVSIDSISITDKSASFSGTGFDDDNLDGIDDGEAVTLTWNYGGTGSLSGNTYTYDTEGVYLVSLTVTDAEGLSQTDWKFAFINVVPGPDPNPDPDPNLFAVLPARPLLTVNNNIIKTGGNQSARIQCDVKETGNLSVAIYDARGREITTLCNEQRDAGVHTFNWSGKDTGTNTIGSGIYMVHMKSGTYSETRKIAVVK